jgi:hypothetical protein
MAFRNCRSLGFKPLSPTHNECPRSDGCPMFASAYVGRIRVFFRTLSARVITKYWEGGFAPSLSPTYARGEHGAPLRPRAPAFLLRDRCRDGAAADHRMPVSFSNAFSSSSNKVFGRGFAPSLSPTYARGEHGAPLRPRAPAFLLRRCCWDDKARR